ncbi:DNA polymerase [Pelistega indica]|uniref:DNA polymerase n=1 Tax=Pelistega indica TaxID=1414851 RepID=V8FTW9_9BURK|nr:nucleotidyltransferase domain-containing protein [Pelistega indica]ETD67734.1 DNA polymerase [Pelistega indica]
MRPSELLKAKKADVEKLFEKYPLITNSRVFGSVARGDDVEGSDIDLLMILRQPKQSLILFSTLHYHC